MPVARGQLAVDSLRELPLASGNRRARRLARVSGGKDVPRIVGRGNRIFDTADAAYDQVP